MDPVTAGTTALGLALGGAQLSIQIFESVVKGFAYFESASNAEQEIQVFKLRLRIEYARLREWGARSALVDHAVNNRYEESIGSQGTLVVSILNALKSKLREMRQSELRYVGIAPEDIKELQSGTNLTANTDFTDDISDPQEITTGSSADDPGEVVAGGLNEEEWNTYDSIFHLPKEARAERKHRRGFNHMFALAQGSLKIVKQPKRFKWAVKDKKHLSDNVYLVKDLIDHLLKTLSRDQMQQVVQDTREIRFAMTAMSKTLEDMLALQQAMQTYGPAPLDDSASMRTLADPNGAGDPDAVIDLNETFASESRFKRMMESVTAFSIKWRRTMVSKPGVSVLEYLKIEGVSKTDTRQHGRMGETPVWLEWKAYDVRPFYLGDGKSEHRPHAEIQGRVERLGALLSMPDRPAQLCIPPFQGIFDDKSNRRFGFVYAPPKFNSKEPLGTTLLSRLRGTAPSLEERIKIAKQLAQWLLFLHTVDWLHKGVRSSSILFFRESVSDDYGRPYVTGFEYSRIVDGGTMTAGPAESLPWAIYTHPHYLEYSEYGYRKTYDIYSIGIILIELAYWQPIHEVLALKYSSPENIPFAECTQAQARLLDPSEGILQQVESKMGKRYAKVTTSCIQGMLAFGLAEEKKQADPLISGLLQQAYIRVVVDTLDEITI